MNFFFSLMLIATARAENIIVNVFENPKILSGLNDQMDIIDVRLMSVVSEYQLVTHCNGNSCIEDSVPLKMEAVVQVVVESSESTALDGDFVTSVDSLAFNFPQENFSRGVIKRIKDAPPFRRITVANELFRASSEITGDVRQVTVSLK